MTCICRRRYRAKCETCDFKFKSRDKQAVIAMAKEHIDTVEGEWPDEIFPNQEHTVVFREENIFYHSWDERREEGDSC